MQSRVEGRRTLYRVTNGQVGSLLAQATSFLEANEAQIACCQVIDAAPKES